MYRNRKSISLEAVQAVHESFKAIASASIMDHCNRLIRDASGSAFLEWCKETLPQNNQNGKHKYAIFADYRHNYGTRNYPDIGPAWRWECLNGTEYTTPEGQYRHIDSHGHKILLGWSHLIIGYAD